MLPLQSRQARALNFRALICVSVAAFSGLVCNVLAEKVDSLDSGQEKGYPWIAHSSVDAFYLTSPTEVVGSQPYQVSFYQGFTIQSLSFASFHMGLRTRETLAPGFTNAYREPFAIKLAATTELIRDFFFVSLGGNIPVFAGTLNSQDTLAIYQAVSEYCPLPFSDFLSPRAMQAEVFARYSWTSWSTLGGFLYARPALFTGLPGSPFYTSPYFGLAGRAILETGSSRHRFDAKSVWYSPEDNSQRIPAHDEGDVWQLRYGYLRSHGKVGWQSGIGLVMRMPDANRKLKLRSPLEKTPSNDNVQRVYGELALSWIPDPDILWRMHLLPKALIALKGAAIGFETEAGLGVGLKIWEVHRIRATGTLLYGSFSGKKYVGFGIKGEFAFRHLGFQDIEEQNDTEVR